MRMVQLLVVAALFLFALPSETRAQGTSGQIPDPISTADLRDLLQTYVRVTPLEWDTVESLHDDYREAFRQLRESEIEAFLLEMRKLQSVMPSKASMDDFFKKYEKVTKRVESVDNTLFDGIAAIVGEDRRGAVDRARDARKRQRLRTGMNMGMGMGMGNADVAAIALKVDLPAAEAEAIDPTLRSYEGKLTALLAESQELSLKGIIEALGEIEKLGLGGLTQEELMADPERMQQVMETMQGAMRKVAEKTRKVNEEIVDTNAKTFRSVLGQMSGDPRRKFRTRYIAAAHPDLSWGDNNMQRTFQAALRLRSAQEDLKGQIQQAYDAWVRSDDAIVDDAIKVANEFAKNQSAFDFDASRWQDYNTKTEEVRTQRAEAANKALDALRGLIGEERLGKIQVYVAQRMQEDPFEMTGDPEGDGAQAGVHASASPVEPDEAHITGWAGLPSPMGVGAVQVLATHLALDETKKAILETLHSDYLKHWESDVTPMTAELQLAQQQAWQPLGDGSAGPNIEAQNRIFAIRERALSKSIELDGAFFDDAAKALGDDLAGALQVARLERVLAVTTQRSGWGSSPFGGESERPVNIVTVIRSANLPDADEASAVALLAERTDELLQAQIAGARKLLEQEREMQELSMGAQSIYTNNNEDGEDGRMSAKAMAAAQEFGMKIMAAQQRMAETATQRAASLRTTFDAVVAAMPEDRQPALSMAYDEQAYPNIFVDPRSARPFIERAREFTDLNDDQKARLTALSDGYRTEYIQLCRQMIPKPVAMTPGGRPEERFMRQMEQANAQTKVRFDRDERSARAVSQLRRILTEDQAKRIPGLSEYEKASADAARGVMAPF